MRIVPGTGPHRHQVRRDLSHPRKILFRIFFRNAINQGIPCFLCDTDGITQDDTVTVNIGQNFVELAENGKRIPLEPLSPVMLDILREGGLVEYLKKNGKYILPR
jgi:3-isopropylmalate/(R)-2-methylmalate dehydratase small subunit